MIILNYKQTNMADQNPHNDYTIDADAQKRLNTPLAHPTGLDPKDKEFLEMLMKMVSEGKIEIYKPSSLINHAVYDTLPLEIRAKADLEAMNLIGSVRDIKDLYDNGFRDSFQIQNLVSMLRLEKDRFEKEGGDLFII
mgnify:CR=1 FL=1